MKKILQLLEPLFRYNLRHPFIVIGAALGLAFLGAFYAAKLKIDTDIVNLLPPDYNSVQAIKRLKESVGSENYFEVAIKSPSFPHNVAFAEQLIEKSMELKAPGKNSPLFSRVEYKKDTRLIQENALYFATGKELDAITTFLTNKIEDAKRSANPFFFELDEEEESEEDSTVIKAFQDGYKVLVPTEYPVNHDSTVLVLKFVPTGSKSDLSFLRGLFSRYDSLLTALNPVTYHPEMQVVWGGSLYKHLLDIDAIISDVQNSFWSGFGSVIGLVMLFFLWKKIQAHRKSDSKDVSLWQLLVRAPVPILIIGLPLLISLVWTFGLAYAAFGILNTMTSVLFVILFGMGIDYGLHFYARYVEFRAEGNSPAQALQHTFDRSGEAIATAALTTAISLGILMVADFRGFSEFGFISFTGILMALFCMMFVMPAIIVILESWNLILISQNEKEDLEVKRNSRFPWSRTIVAAGLGILILVFIQRDKLAFEYDFGKLEQEHPETIPFTKTVEYPDYTATKRNPAYIIGESYEEIDEIVAAIRQKMAVDTLTPTILDVEALQERFPGSPALITEKLRRIENIRQLLNDPFIRNQEGEDLSRLRKASKTARPLDIQEVPDYLKSKFLTKNGEMGRFVMIYPSVRLADGRNSIAFKDDVSSFVTASGKTVYSGSTSLVGAEMLDLMIRESPWMVGTTCFFIVAFMMGAFRSVRWTLIGLLPLVIGVCSLLLVMMVFDIAFNFYNLVVLPAILGIGEDNGVHLAHRYREEGRGSMWHVLSSTGQHISIGSLTTMLGFAGLIFTKHPGLQSIGIIATLGVGFTWIASLLFLPAMVQVLEDRNWIRF